MKVRYRMIFAMVLAITLVWPALGRGGAPQTITFLTAPWGVPPDQALLKSFENRSGITVQIISAPSAEMYTKVQVASAGRRAPADVIFLTEEAPSFIVAPGYMEPLDARVAKSADLNAGDIERMDFWTVGGKIQGITTYVQMVMMDYNAKRLGAGGFNTGRDVGRTAAAVRRAEAEGRGSIPDRVGGDRLVVVLDVALGRRPDVRR